MKRTLQSQTKRKMKRKLGFFARKKAGTGVLAKRRAKGRKKLSA
ncbi:MAG: 50S ribosomal protein L34 [Alphaproteobacteria bacterium]|jgi:ribosomal protein L34|nr:50S ribosomal protein L34 [Alphaproteobacteria bacterium]